MSEMNTQVLLAARPIGLPKETDFEIVQREVESPAEGQVLVRQRLLSLDPAMRGWMNDRRSYVPPVGLGEVMRGYGVGEVVESRSEAFTPGDLVAGLFGWQRFATMDPGHLEKIPPGIDARVALGPLGMTGLTAYFGLLDIGEPKEGETVLVSGAAGAVGSIVGQIAKIKGCRAVGLAGSDEKCAWIVDELGYDEAINYKTAGDMRAALSAACPDGIDIYFDNVGGEILDAALGQIAFRGRVVICGAISMYNATEPQPGPANYIHLLVQRARMEGFIIFDYIDRYREAQAELGRWMAEERIKYREHVVQGLEKAPQALLMLFDGSNRGKLMVEVD